MAHFAELNPDNIVLRVLVIDNKDCCDIEGNEIEEVGVSFCTNLFGGRWIQTSYNARIRGKYAAIGDFYDANTDEFVYAWWINRATGKMFTKAEFDYIEAVVYYSNAYRFMPAIEKTFNATGELAYCLNNDQFIYPSFEYLEHGRMTDKAGLPIKIDGDKIELGFRSYTRKVVDLGEIGIIVHAGLTDWFDYDVMLTKRKIHPQAEAYSAHELFRLMLEWDFCYTEFGNREVTAIRCHEALAKLEIPQNVIDDLWSDVEDQTVARFLKGLDPYNPPHFCKAPSSFEEWFKTIENQ